MGSLSSMLTAQFSDPREQPAAALAHWRATPPEWLPARYGEIEDSYNSVTWEWRHVQLMMRIIPFAGWFGGATCYRITALFESDGAFGSRITVNGTVDERTQDSIEAAAEHFQLGGTV
jgi:hypothetical protein